MRFSRQLIFLLIIAGGAGCDSTPGLLPTAAEQAPSIKGLSIEPKRVVYGLLDQSNIDGDSIRITLNLSATVDIPGSAVSQIFYAILSPDSSRKPIQLGSLPPIGNNRYAGGAELTLSALDVQSYPVLVYPVDVNNRLGAEARTTLEYVRSFEPGSPPSIDQLSIPATFQRPNPGEPARALFFIAQVSDPDGLSNIELVEFWNNNIPGIRYLLCDDGNIGICGTSSESGDAEAADGQFTRQVFITSTNSLGNNTFTFEAIDRAGLRSQQVSHTIEIIE